MLKCLVVVYCWAAVSQGKFVPPPNYEIYHQTTERAGFGSVICGEDDINYHCVPYYECNSKTNTTISDDDYDYDEEEISAAKKPSSDFNSCTNSIEVCCGINTKSDINSNKPKHCGIHISNGIDPQITGGKSNEAKYGEFPWMMAIMKQNYNPTVDSTPIVCGGSLIVPNIVLTGAHCVYKHQPADLKVRAGEWDTATTAEPLPHQDRAVSAFIVHPAFSKRHLLNDIALLVLESHFEQAPHISTVCLPAPDAPLDPADCFASGWGRLAFGAPARATVTKKLRVPLVESGGCERRLRQTRLGAAFALDDSLVCAGGAPGTDACTGDGGGPLVCADARNPRRFHQVGVVAWGIGCGDGVPGVYANVAKFRKWIDEQLEFLYIDNKFYTV